jgi:hypothetical protein
VNRERIEEFVMRYLEATGCHVVEKSDAHVTVRFSPEADKDLMNRSYYWGFVERTGAEPEPMSFTFVFDPEARAKAASAAPGARQPIKAGQGQVMSPGTAGGFTSAGAGAAASPGAMNGMGTGGINPSGVGYVPGGTAGPAIGAAPGSTPGASTGTTTQAVPSTGTGAAAPAAGAPAAGGDSILGRYFGFVPTGATSRIPSDVMMFGSRRLEQLFSVVQSRGRFIRLFEEPKPEQRNPFASIGYSTWLGINYKVEFICDMKREELHSFGIHLGTGQITDKFFERVRRRSLSPKLPPNIHLQPVTIPLSTAVEILEGYLETLVKGYDHRWSDEAIERLREERRRIDAYFGELLQSVEPDKKAEVEEQYSSRDKELEWQYYPRISISVINCGFFHLADGLRTAIDSNR